MSAMTPDYGVEVECLGDDVWALVFTSLAREEAYAIRNLLHMRPFAARVRTIDKTVGRYLR